jgi:hypothetical protein
VYVLIYFIKEFAMRLKSLVFLSLIFSVSVLGNKCKRECRAEVADKLKDVRITEEGFKKKMAECVQKCRESRLK